VGGQLVRRIFRLPAGYGLWRRGAIAARGR